MNGMQSRIDEAEAQCQKLHANGRTLQAQVENLEQSYDNEQRARVRVRC